MKRIDICPDFVHKANFFTQARTNTKPFRIPTFSFPSNRNTLIDKNLIRVRAKNDKLRGKQQAQHDYTRFRSCVHNNGRIANLLELLRQDFHGDFRYLHSDPYSCKLKFQIHYRLSKSQKNAASLDQRNRPEIGYS